ncbi:hypothetical protein G51EAM_00496 [Candidatus Nanoperiomorbus periodonticus]|nr:hypothetical protein [Candidatus Nanoperiomorbus periodonticus]RYC76092.1 hypothetical protein G51EAM_00496 [Candidatus Nanoperiomorbus periodonticus]
MMEAKIIDRKSWLVWLNRVFLAVAVTMIISIARGSSAMALSNVGPSSPGDRYNLTEDSTHSYTELEVPVYFKDKPGGDVGIKVFDALWGDSNNGAIFNGGVHIHGDGHFTINAGDFWYDSSTGYWKAMVRAYLIGKIFQFKLQLDRGDGIIAYATGRASQASTRYNGRMRDIIGHERKEMQMALPCSFTEPTHLGGPGSPYHLRLYDLDTWYPWWGTNNGKQPLSVSVYDESDNGRRVAYYDGNNPEYQCGQLGAGDDGVYGSHGCMGENGVLYVEMTMYPDHKYKIVIDNVWKNNLIEYELPFDNIFYNIACEPKVDMRTTVDFTKSVNKGRFKQLSSYGKYNSNEGKGNGNNSIAEVMGYPGKYHFKKWEGISPQDSGSLPKAIMDSDKLQGHGGELYPGDVLTWWFRAYNSSGYIVPEEMKMDFTNLREGWIDSRPPGQSWNQPEPKPEKGSNWFWPADRGGPLNGSDHRQVMWGCYGWDKECTDYSKGFNGSDPNHGVSISKQEAVEKHYRYMVKSGDAGQTLCQWLRMSWNYNGWKQRLTPKACVKIPYHYPPPPDDKDKHSGVVPTARVADGYKSKVQAGDDVQFSYSLTNTSGSGSTVSRQIEYRSYTFILRRGAKLPQNSEQKPYHYAKRWDGNGVGCGGRDIIPGTQGRCEQGVGGTSEKIYPGQTWPVPGGQPKYNVSGIWLAQPGDKICSYIAIDNNWSVKNDQSADTFRASNIACVVVTKSPNLNLSGSDSYAKDGFTGSDVRENIVPGTDKRGSYSQYGLLTGDKNGVTNFGSAGYTTASQANHRLACKLSYANTGNVKDDCKDLNGLKPANLFKNPLSTPSSTNAQQLPGGSSVNLSILSGSYKTTSSGSLKISGDLGKGQHITIFAEKADVTITGKIDAYAGPYNKLSDIPSFTIMAKNIKVNPGVSLITGTYVAKDHFESCNNGAQEKGPTLGVEGVCKNKLKVNGAIVSVGSPVFRRTFGAGNNSDDYQWDTDRISSTAEWINYTPNLWLTTSNGSSGNQLEGLTTTQVTNLPVRY